LGYSAKSAKSVILMLAGSVSNSKKNSSNFRRLKDLFIIFLLQFAVEHNPNKIHVS